MRTSLHRSSGLRAAVCLLLALVVCLGCGASGLEKRRKGYEAFYRGDFPSALESFEKAGGEKDRLLAALDRGVILHTEGRAEESNEAFARAEEILAEVSVTDVSDVATSLLINDYRLAYKGEDFEKVLVHPFKALNYLCLGRPDEALVECRAVNNRLVELQEENGRKSVYAEDAFARYLSGIIYESEGDRNGALVDYRLAEAAFEKHAEAYGTPFPASLREALIRLSDAQEQRGLAEEYRTRWPGAASIPYKERRGMGELVVVLENGPAPVKEEARFDLFLDDEIFSVAFPTYRAIAPRAASATVRVGDRSAPTELVGDVTAIAIKDLEDRYHRVVAKELARLALKHAEVEKLEKKNSILGHLLNFVNTLNERADLRSWETLPSNFQIARLVLPAGAYPKVELDLHPHEGAPVETIDLGPWEVKAGETRFFCYRTLD